MVVRRAGPFVGLRELCYRFVMNPTWWIVLGVGLFVLEIAVPGFVLACFGVGSLAAGLAAYFADSLTIELAAFSLGSFAAFLFVRPLFNHPSLGPRAATNIEAYVGRVGRVVEATNPDGEGRASVGGELWKIRSDACLSEGARVVVRSVEGLVLVVAPFEPSGKERC